MACDEEFCSNYLVLKSEEASLFDLFRILFSSDFEKRSFIEIYEAENLRGRRWIIFMSLVVQKLLFYLKNPMARFGAMLEYSLNLAVFNGGVVSLILTRLQGKEVKQPDKFSPMFTSVVGIVDKRVDLDETIRSSDSRYIASLSIMASKLSYENKAFVQTVITDHWQMQFLGHDEYFNAYQESRSTGAIMFQDTSVDPNLIVVAFRGTEPFNADDWQTDIDISWYEIEGVGKIHGGFMKALGLQKNKGWPKKILQGPKQPRFAYYTIREKLRQLLEKNDKANFIVTGHSLGGALAILFVSVLVLHEDEKEDTELSLLGRLQGVYTFGQPRVGDEQFRVFMNRKLKEYNVKYCRYVYCNDMVPRLPYDDKTILYKHFGPCLYYDSCYKGKILEEEPNKNYFSLLWVIPKILNAWWELIRSFILPFIRGPDYKEGWAFRFFRLIGTVIPGLSAHTPEDYVNVTRIGTDLSSLLILHTTPQHGLKVE